MANPHGLKSEVGRGGSANWRAVSVRLTAPGLGIPTVKLETEFLSPSELGDELMIEIDPQHVGRSSCTFGYLFTGDGRDRLRGQATIVCMDLAAQQSAPWPDALRERIVAFGAESKV